jgi:hypothetical protein
MILAGCGSSGGGKLPDAAPSDGNPSSPVTLTVTLDGKPIAGVHTYFLDPDDAPIATVDTDATGTAQAMMPRGGSVTALDPFPQSTAALALADNNQLITIAGAKPGDHLVLGRTTGDVDVTLRAPIEATADSYDVHTTCGSGSLGRGSSGNSSGPLFLFGCHGAADIVIVSNSASTTTQSATPISGLYHPDAAVVANGIIDVTLDHYSPLTPVTFTYLNAPDGSISVEHSPILPHGPLDPFTADVTGGAVTILEPTLPAANSTITTRFTASAEQLVIDTGPSTTSYTLDVKDLLLPDIPAPAAFDPTTGHVSWVEGTTGATPDLTVNFIHVQRGDVTSGRRWDWAIMAPYHRGEIAFPHLPGDVFGWTPIASDTVSAEEVTNVKITGGYDAIRARALSDNNIAPAPGQRLIAVTSLH